MHHFYAYLSRLKLIRRWSLMRNTQPENDAEHSLQAAFIAHGLALLARDRYGRDVNPEHVLSLAVYHDASEVLTGDLPTPVKYHSEELRSAYHRVEELASKRLLGMLPESLRPSYAPYLSAREDDEAWAIVKAADKLCAYVKCLEEQRAGNHEFDAAREKILSSLESSPLPEVQDFLREFVPSFALTLDELNGGKDV